SLEITKGNFVPILTHAIGWSQFMAPFFYLFGSTSIFQNMVYARIISDFVGALSIFPLAYIGKKLLDDKRSLIFLLILFVFSSQLIMSSTSALTEPLFTFLLLMSVYFIIKAGENQNYILIASLFGAFAYYVRPNGILVLLIILFSFFLLRREIPKFNYKYIIYIAVIFFAISAPFLYQRYTHFGSAFFYGENSKYFVDTYQQVWSNNVPVPSLMDYLSTHTLTDYFNKFVIYGFFNIIFDYVYGVISPLLLFFFLYGILMYFNNKKFLPLIVVFFIWVIGLTPVWDIFGTPRHLYPTIPFILIFSTVAINEVSKNNRYRNVLLSLFLIVFILFSLITPVGHWYKSPQSSVHDGLEWGRWAAQNIKGKIAIIEGGDLIMMHLPDTMVSGVGQLDLYAPTSNLSVVRPGYFENLSSAMEWFKEIGVTHLALDDNNINRRPYLREIYSGKEIPSYLIEVYSNYDTDSKWKMRIYYVNWSEWEKSQTRG
ncbi:MAG TPA: hypothetical protein EYP80_01835, partial [Candidatus Aenigmarchaeota archaeon]|nr:hypothetical protein [Candidatus Aenigmarchaeota archaeon]